MKNHLSLLEMGKAQSEGPLTQDPRQNSAVCDSRPHGQGTGRPHAPGQRSPPTWRGMSAFLTLSSSHCSHAKSRGCVWGGLRRGGFLLSRPQPWDSLGRAPRRLGPLTLALLVEVVPGLEKQAQGGSGCCTVASPRVLWV